jgi:murein DD-endopeptidase MepM/ murein hydrolase activator NlpD
MRPVSDEFPVTQAFGSYATGGVIADPNGTEVQQLVAAYGNYQQYGHAGQDIGCPIGTPVHAIAAGTVLWADWGTNLPGDESDAGYRQRWYLYKTFPGIVVVIQHAGWIGVYAHLSETPLNPGDTVTESQQIALSGNTRAPGVTLGAHLHVEALIDDSYSTGSGLIYGRTDPTPFFGSGTISTQSTPTPQEDELSQADVERIINEVNAANEAKHVETRKQVAAAAKSVIDAVYGFTTTLHKQYHDAALNELPAAVVDFNYRPGANLAGALDAIAFKTVGETTALDSQAIADAIVNGVNIQIVKK